jgi:chemotaxis response regulator CheB
VVPENTKRVLVVDDSAFTRRLIAEVVELRDGFRAVGMASDGFASIINGMPAAALQAAGAGAVVPARETAGAINGMLAANRRVA